MPCPQGQHLHSRAQLFRLGQHHSASKVEFVPIFAACERTSMPHRRGEQTHLAATVDNQALWNPNGNTLPRHGIVCWYERMCPWRSKTCFCGECYVLLCAGAPAAPSRHSTRKSKLTERAEQVGTARAPCTNLCESESCRHAQIQNKKVQHSSGK